jgi:hypothetical protein
MQAQSFFDHIHGKKLLKIKTSNYLEFLHNASVHEKLVIIKRCGPKPIPISVTRNTQALSLGYPHANANNVTDFKIFLEKLDKDVFHVSILEEMSASLVLLKRKLCWNIKDILHGNLHVSKNKWHPEKDSEMTHLLELHKKWSTLDYVLYDHYLQKLHYEVSIQSQEEFSKELIEYHWLEDEFITFCLKMCEDMQMINNINIKTIMLKLQISKTIVSSMYHQNITVSYRDCVMQAIGEMEVKTVLIHHQYNNQM